jgi:GntR family transcriptional regulator
MAATTTGSGEGPRYVQVAAALVGDIENGRYPVGSLLPPEPELCDRYNVSRHTLREATRRLVEAGLIDRKQGVGTRVRARAAEARYVASINALEDLFEYTRQTRLDVVGERIVNASGPLVELLRCRPGQPWLTFETRRYPRGGTDPIAHLTAFVPPAYEAIRDHLHTEGVSVYGLIEELFGERIAGVEQRVEAIALPAEVAALLDAAPGAPALRIARSYAAADGRILSASITTHPPARFVLRSEWRLALRAADEAP